MKTTLLFLTGLLFALTAVFADGYEPGDKASDFKLRNVDGSWVSLSDFKDAKGFVVVFTCNGCPYAMAYQERIMEIDRIYKPKGYPVIAINPNDTDIKPDDTLDALIAGKNPQPDFTKAIGCTIKTK